MTTPTPAPFRFTEMDRAEMGYANDLLSEHGVTIRPVPDENSVIAYDADDEEIYRTPDMCSMVDFVNGYAVCAGRMSPAATPQARHCERCGGPYYAKARCQPCYKHRWDRGVERPLPVTDGKPWEVLTIKRAADGRYRWHVHGINHYTKEPFYWNVADIADPQYGTDNVIVGAELIAEARKAQP
jgi:hypothetical protein